MRTTRSAIGLTTGLLIAWATTAAPTARAADGVLYTCVNAKGHRTYQNAPCPPGSETHGVRPYLDPGWNPQAAAKVEADRQAVERRHASDGDYSFGWPEDRRRDPKVDRCRAAKAHREAVLETAGLSRTYDLLSQLDREVYDACKDAPGA
jgi:hypothetical protein